MDRMKAYLFKTPGGVKQLKYQDVALPTLEPDELLVKVRAIGINYAEVLSRKGQYSWAPPRPYVPGMEASGEVVQVGSQVSRFKPGDRVIAGAQFGAYAEFMKTREHLTFSMPVDWTWADGAAFLVNFITAWVSLFKLGKLQAGEKVLIQAAAGGVGTAAVQLARCIGARIAGTASKEEKLSLLKKLGVELPINYHQEDFRKIIASEWQNIDLCLEVVGGEVFRKSKALLGPFGRLVVTGYASIPLKKWKPWTWWPAWRDAPKVGVMDMAKGSYAMAATHIGYLTSNPEVAQKIWEELIAFTSQHHLKPIIGKTFSFDSLADAHTYLESRESVGKVVVTL